MKFLSYFYIVFLLCFNTVILTQTSINSKVSIIKGYVYDSSTNKPLEFANVILFKSADSSQVKGTTTNTKGYFEINNIHFGNFCLVLSFLGYNNKSIDSILVVSGQPVDLGRIYLNHTAYSLNEIKVKGDRAPISYELDKKVINVSKQFASSSGSAVDVLENIPSVTVDIDGNVSLRGSTNFTVLVDGRQSVLEASDALQQIPASSIKSIEIVTNPSAKYNPEGTSGIINVILKKDENLGLSGTFELNGGLRDKYGSEALFDYKTNDYGINFGVDYNKRLFTMNQIGNSSTLYNGSITTVNSSGSADHGRTSYGLRGSLDFDISQIDLLTFGGRFGYRDNSRGTNRSYSESIDNIEKNYVSNSDRRMKGDFYSMFSSFKHKFSNDGHEITGDASYNYRQGDENNNNNLYNANNIMTEGQIAKESGPSKNFRIKADYILPINVSEKFEAGYQSEFHTSMDINELYNYNNISGQYEFQPKYSSYTNYRRNIHSIYSLFSDKLGSLEFQLGFRTELTDRSTTLVDSNESFSIYRWDYFPGIHTSFKFNEENQLMASYTRRINRPRGFFLEPFRTWMDAYNVRVGNPALKPEYIDSYELGYQILLGETVISAEGYYRVNNNKIEWVKSVLNNDVSLNTFENVGKDYSLGSEFMFNFDPIEIWNINLIGNLYNYKVEGELYNNNFSRSNFSWNLRFNNTIKFTNSTSVQVNGRYNSPRVSAQSEYKSSFSLNLALRQSFFRNTFIATLQIRDLIGTHRWESILQAPDYYNYFRSLRESPIVMVNLKFIFNNYNSENKTEDNGDDNFNPGENFRD